MKHFTEDRSTDRFGNVISANIPRKHEKNDEDRKEHIRDQHKSRIIREGPTYVEVDEFGNS